VEKYPDDGLVAGEKLQTVVETSSTELSGAV
jgi:hypothetical protein